MSFLDSPLGKIPPDPPASSASDEGLRDTWLGSKLFVKVHPVHKLRFSTRGAKLGSVPMELAASFIAFFMLNDCFIKVVCWKKCVFQMVEGFCFNKSQKPHTLKTLGDNSFMIHGSCKKTATPTHASKVTSKKGVHKARRECTEETKGSVRTTIWHYMTLCDTMWLYESTAYLYLHGP